MGKKEKEIASKNAEYYREMNQSIHNEYLAYEQEQEQIAYTTGLLEEEAIDLLENTVNQVLKELKTYAYDMSLPLCENLDLINIENYISFVLVGCPEPKRKKQEFKEKEYVVAEEKKPLMSQNEYETLCSEIKELTVDCDRIKNQNFISLGEDEMSRSYSEFFKGTIFTLEKQKEIIKRVGTKEYNKVVLKLGQIEYEKIRLIIYIIYN